jgi:hypothetical protein
MLEPVTFDLDERLMKLAHRAFLAKRGLSIGNVLASVLPFGIIGAFFVFLGGAWIYVGAGLLGAGAAAGMWTGALWHRAYRSRIANTLEVLARRGSPHFHLEFTDEGVRSQSDLSSGQAAWKTFRELYRAPDVWLLFITKSRYLILPATSLSIDIQRFIVQKCGEHKIPVIEASGR